LARKVRTEDGVAGVETSIKRSAAAVRIWEETSFGKETF
jgi:hypothetical protein